MPIRNALPISFVPYGVCDAIDSTELAPGAMMALKNLIPNPRDRHQFVPRPASTQITNFASFTSPAQGNALLVVGTRAYGMIASGRFAGCDEPFCYDLANGAFITIAGVTAANCPLTPAATGDWTPPTMTMVGSRIVITHPGYDGTTHFIGWIDTRAFTYAGATFTVTSGSPILTVASSDPLIAGVQVGDAATGTGIPAGTTVKAITSTSVTLSANATASGTAVAVTFTSGTKAAPTYGSGQTNGTTLKGVPVAVAQFNGRAYYAVANGVQFSDALSPLQISLATQALTLGDDVAVTALGGVPLGNAYVGGVSQSLIAFKGDGLYYQITGDPATSDLKLNAVNGSVGTLAPNTISPTPKGLAYIAPDGLRLITPDGTSSDPIGAHGVGINLPFLFAVNPTRMAGAFSKNVYRVSVQNGAKDGQPTEEYWYDFDLGAWTGPHSFPAALIAPYHAGTNNFILFAKGVNAKLWQSSTTPSAASTYTENGAAMAFEWQPTLLPDNQQNAANQIVETALALALPATQALTIQALDENNTLLDTLALSGDNRGGAIWGSFTWGGQTWGGSVASFRQYLLKWTKPLVFKQLSLRIVGPSTSGLVIGNLYGKYQTLGYQGAYG